MKALMDNLIKKAAWVAAPERFACPVIIRKFRVDHPERTFAAVCALGFFILYINGERVGDEYFRPSNSLFCQRETEKFLYPIKDKFTYRCYYSVYDISQYLKPGENVMEIALGNGWFRQTERIAEGDLSFGNALAAIYAIHSENCNILSDGSELCRSSNTVYSQLFYGEIYDARIKEYEYAPVNVIDMSRTLLTEEIAPPDRIVRRISPVLISETENRKIYDVGENISGFAVLSATLQYGEKVFVRFAEQFENGSLVFRSTGSDYKNPDGKAQIMEDIFIGDGEHHIFMPKFVWHGFRYFEIEGNADAVCAAVVHSDVPITAKFSSSSDELNWIFDAFVRTQLDNMHGGVPSDCPHRERLGYTGDGQICSEAAMLLLGAESFYRKWIQDIFDSQDTVSGHVNHTAPFAGGGGGPGGWGCAAVFVPYNFYRIYGDSSLIRENYVNMRNWIEYLSQHSLDGLVVCEEKDGWCLGDWCTPEKTVIPEAYVNTCCFIKALRIMEYAAKISGAENDIDYYRDLCRRAEATVRKKYFNKEMQSFCDGIQGADAFAIYCGIADKHVINTLLNRYRRAEAFDTGFIGTMLLCGALFENGGEDIAFTLLAGHTMGTFGYMADRKATTLWETWDGQLSQNHPMFGACAVYLITHILGISQEKTSAGFDKILIAPKIPGGLESAQGSAVTPAGKLQVSWHKRNGQICFKIELPENTEAVFKYKDCRKKLSERINNIIV